MATTIKCNQCGTEDSILTLTELANILGIRRETVWKMMNGRKTNPIPYRMSYGETAIYILRSELKMWAKRENGLRDSVLTKFVSRWRENDFGEFPQMKTPEIESQG